MASRNHNLTKCGLVLLAVWVGRPPLAYTADRRPHQLHPLVDARASAHAVTSGRLAEATKIQLLLAATSADPSTTTEQQHRFRQQLRQLLDEDRRHCPRGGSDWQRAEATFRFLHSHLLTGRYDDGCARVQRTLDDGTHNCLTATLYYLVLARHAGIAAVAVAAPGHVAVRVGLGGSVWHVETTHPRWLPTASNAPDSGLDEISDAALLGRVYYNLGIRLARAGDYERALMATRYSVQLDPHHPEARGNLLATLNNWSIDLVGRGEFERAESLIQEGLRMDGQYTPLRRSEAFLQQQRRLAATP